MRFWFFQFYYPYPLPTHGSPKLRVYAMKAGHKKVSDVAFKLVDYKDADSVPVVLPDTPQEHITGDLQLRVTDMEDLKEAYNPGTPEVYSFFVFVPKYDSGNQHIYYEVSVFPSTALQAFPIDADPSPPATAV